MADPPTLDLGQSAEARYALTPGSEIIGWWDLPDEVRQALITAEQNRRYETPRGRGAIAYRP